MDNSFSFKLNIDAVVEEKSLFFSLITPESSVLLFRQLLENEASVDDEVGCCCCSLLGEILNVLLHVGPFRTNVLFIVCCFG